jgi:hypothetical protein
MDILIKSFQTYYKLPEYLSTECDWIQWTQNIDQGSSENLMCQTSTLERNTRNKLLESNKSFEKLLVTLIQFHFQKNTIQNFNNPVEYEDAYNLTFQLAYQGQLQELYDFSIYRQLYKSKSSLIKQTIPSMYPEVIYIVQFIDHIFKHLHSTFKSLNKASIKSYTLLESKKPTKLINEKTKLEKKHKELSLLITDSIQQSQKDEVINKLVTEQNTLKSKIQELDNKITDINLKEITNRIDKNLTLGDKFMNGFVFNTDIITYLLFLNTETIPLELFGTLNRQLNIQNTKFLIFLIDKFTNIIKDKTICYITSSVLDEFKTFEQKTLDNKQAISPTEQLTTLFTSKTVSPKHKIEILFTNFIKLSEPLGQSILYSIIQKLGFGSRLTF